MASTSIHGDLPTSEGEMIWDLPGTEKKCKTWYKVYGDLKSGVRPLVALHGGPGVTSDYLTTFSDLTLKSGIPVVLYDQLGNGLSTHFPEKMGDTVFWTEQLFLNELRRLLNHLGIYDNYDLLGHSWGGMLGARHAVRQPGGLKRLVIMSSPASNKLWMEAGEVLRRKLPQDVQDTLDRCEKEGKTESKEYQDAVKVYYSRFLCTIDPMPEALQKSFGWLEKDPTVYLTMLVHSNFSHLREPTIDFLSRNGPSEFYMTGPIKDWTIVDEAHKIPVPVLLVNGWKDEAADSCVYPFFKLVPRVRWIQFAVLPSHAMRFQLSLTRYRRNPAICPTWRKERNFSRSSDSSYAKNEERTIGYCPVSPRTLQNWKHMCVYNLRKIRCYGLNSFDKRLWRNSLVYLVTPKHI